ncbi:LysR family transcriptional regulator [Acetobacter pomorum]|uniref:LysR family transcriptional regulator n=1 Tax=Acetobacter pomorum TaxID=65959 RepID=A0A2G4RE46_9PROT|nr:LysR family transcriptional regulator [Acetobacter pomorum]PHY94859.1 LysR family transcriptional regulator [Acetobacter pomorum]GBR48907.1 LysR family transcriptional regulator [Acetobacter pomorum DSM 11825]
MEALRLAQLQIFCAVMEEGSVVAASRRMHCVASNVTARLKELEQLLGQELFAREKGRLVPTPEGRLFYHEAREVVEKAHNLASFFQPDVPRGILRIGALDVALAHFLPQYMPGFMATHPDVEIRLLRRASYTLEHMLEDQELDLAITDGPIAHPLLESRFAFTEELVLVAPPNIQNLHDIHWPGVTVFLFHTDCFYRSAFERWMAEQELTPRAIQTVESYDVIRACVRDGIGISCFPKSIFAQQTPHDVRVLAAPGLRAAPVYCVWRRNGAKPLLHRFVNTICPAEAY